MKDTIKDKLLDIARYSYNSLLEGKEENIQNLTINMKVFVSSGKGDFWLYSYDKEPIVYVVVYVTNLAVKELYQGVKQISMNEIKDLTSAKSISYIQNCMMANLS